MTVKRLSQDAIFLALLVVSAFTNVNLPITEITFTLQVLVVFLIALLLPFKDALYIMIAYITMGLIGIPVFSAGGGISYVLKPTFGYILGFIFVPCVMALVHLLPIKKRLIKDILASILGLVIVYAFGTIYFYLLKNVYGNPETLVPLSTILALCVTPFIPFDTLKITLSLILAYKLVPFIELEKGKKKNSSNA